MVSGPCRLSGPIAQRLEQRTHNPLVPGSNPGGPTKSLRCNGQPACGWFQVAWAVRGPSPSDSLRSRGSAVLPIHRILVGPPKCFRGKPRSTHNTTPHLAIPERIRLAVTARISTKVRTRPQCRASERNRSHRRPSNSDRPYRPCFRKMRRLRCAKTALWSVRKPAVLQSAPSRISMQVRGFRCVGSLDKFWNALGEPLGCAHVSPQQSASAVRRDPARSIDCVP